MSISTATIALAALVLSGQEYAPQQDGPQRVAPRGTYAQSCTGEYVNQGRLYADCRDRRGGVRGTSIELNRCSSSDIANDDGRLICGNHRGDYEGRPGNGGGNGGGGNGGGGNGGGGNGNGGGWEGRNNVIVVYRDADFRGPSREFRGEVRNLANSGFNDTISSMVFRGEWLACTDADFRGQCQTFRNDVRNLARRGMNDRISSLRPVRRDDRW